MWKLQVAITSDGIATILVITSDGLATILAITSDGVATILALVWRDSEKQKPCSGACHTRVV